MLRFFSAIRKSLLSENKTVRYLQYAVGEIVLIVVGILIALQINNWKEAQILEEQRSELVRNLHSDFRITLERLEELKAQVEETRDDLQAFLKNATSGASHLSMDELKNLAIAVRENQPFEPSLGFYQSAISTGSIALLEGSQLNHLFLDFERVNNRIQDLEKVAFDLTYSSSGAYMKIREQLGTLGILMNDFGWDYIPGAYQLSDEDYRQFISQKEVYAFFDMKRGLKQNQRRRLAELKRITEQILAELEALE